jgi:hypothetical protein
MFPKRRAAVRTLPVQKPRLPVGLLRKYSQVPLRRPRTLPQNPAEEPVLITLPMVNALLAAARQGNAVDVPAEGRQLTVKVVPDARDAIQQTGLSPDGLSRFLERLADALGSEEAVAKLRQVPALPGLQEYRTILGRPGRADVFRFVFAVLPESSAVVIVSCSYHTVRIN